MHNVSRARFAAKAAQANANTSRGPKVSQVKHVATSLPHNYEQLSLDEQFNVARQLPFHPPSTSDAAILELEQLFSPYNNGKDFDLMPPTGLVQQQQLFHTPASDSLDDLVNSALGLTEELASIPALYPHQAVTTELDLMSPAVSMDSMMSYFESPTSTDLTLEELFDQQDVEDPNTFLTTNSFVVSTPYDFPQPQLPTISIDTAPMMVESSPYPMPPSPAFTDSTSASSSPLMSPLPSSHIPTTQNGLLDVPQPTSKPRSAKKTFKCTLPGCTKEFTRKYNLASHIRCHSGERPFVCPHCTQTEVSFARKHDLRRHIKSLHSEMRPHRCTHCNLSFSRSDALKRHLAIEAKRMGGLPVTEAQLKEEFEDDMMLDDEEL
ncbi:hypothetical protein HDV00_011886 [Rhizophlyctis rosea]|nr:hypothetical protein HDV00_011886 [Rhizophlyctis rosea]